MNESSTRRRFVDNMEETTSSCDLLLLHASKKGTQILETVAPFAMHFDPYSFPLSEASAEYSSLWGLGTLF